MRGGLFYLVFIFVLYTAKEVLHREITLVEQERIEAKFMGAELVNDDENVFNKGN